MDSPDQEKTSKGASEPTDSAGAGKPHGSGFPAAADSLTGGDAQEEFAQLNAALVEEWQPETATERALVENLATAMGRLIRCRQIERALWEEAMLAPAGTVPTNRPAMLERLDRQDAHLNRIVERTVKELRRFRKQRRTRGKTSNQAGAPPKEEPARRLFLVPRREPSQRPAGKAPGGRNPGDGESPT